MYCMKCGTQMADDADFCSKCGERLYHVDETKEMSVTQCENPPQNSVESQMYTNIPVTEQTPPIIPRNNAVEATISDFLHKWKTNILFTILGIVSYIIIPFLITLIAAQIYSDLPPWVAAYKLDDLANIYPAILCILTVIYSIAIYPSYFKDKPLISKVRLVSYLNGLFGFPIIFTLLWNRNLTKGKKGVSHIVATIYYGIGAIYFIATISII